MIPEPSLFSLMVPHLPVLLVILPLVAAPLIIIIRHATPAWMIATAVSLGCFVISLALMTEVIQSGTITYNLGDWAAPWGIEYRIDRVSALMALIVSAIASLVAPYARRSIAHEVAPDRVYLFYSMFLLSLAGLIGITMTGDVFNLFVFLEISSLSSYVLIGLGRDRRALTAAYRYLIMGTIGATFYIIGVGMMYMMTGTLNISDLASILPAIADTKTVLVAMAFLIVGVSLKIALFPLHLWLPNVYAFAPTAVTVFLAATATKVAVYILIRITFTVFGGTDLFSTLPTSEILMIFAIIGMFAASAVAIFQNNVKRMLANSSIAQIGYMVLGISFFSVSGLAGSIIHIFNHAITKGALFMAIGCIVYRTGSVNISAMNGIGRRMPITMAAFVIAGLSLIGVPLTVGFVSKWYLIQAALEQGLFAIAVLVVLSSLLAVIYIWRVIEAAYFQPSPNGAKVISEAPASMLIPLWVLTGASVYFGIDATRTVNVAFEAAFTLINGTGQ